MNEGSKILVVDDSPRPPPSAAFTGSPSELVMREGLAKQGSLCSGGLVGGPRPLMAAMLALAALGGGGACDVVTPFDRLPDLTPKKPREKTADDLARIEAARLKRERKALKKSARTTTPNIQLSGDGAKPRRSL